MQTFLSHNKVIQTQVQSLCLSWRHYWTLQVCIRYILGMTMEIAGVVAGLFLHYLHLKAVEAEI